jgi:hypothetical protein
MEAEPGREADLIRGVCVFVFLDASEHVERDKRRMG